jgi:tetratricopeptide (TPR) repeat protein
VGEEKEAVGSRQRFAGERLSVHELVRQAVRFSRPPEARPGFPEILGHVARVLADCLHQANSAENWQSIGPEIAHCRHVESLCQAGHTDSYFELLLGLGVFYCEHWEAHIGLGYLQRGWELVRAQQGEENLLAAQFLRQLADAHRKLSEFPKARMLAEQATSLAAKVLPGRHPDLAEYYGTTGLICKFQADELKSDAEKQQRLAHYKEAERYYQEALQLLEPVKAERPGEYAMYLSNIGLIHEALGDPDSALDYVLRAFLIIRRPLGVHRKVAVRLNNIGRILRQQVRAFDEQGSLRCKQKKLQQALRFHQRAQRIYKDILDHEQLDSAYTHYYLGETHYEMQQKDSAAQAYLRALPLFKRYGREALCEAIELRLREIEDETRIPREERPDQQSFEQVEPERPMLWM